MARRKSSDLGDVAGNLVLVGGMGLIAYMLYERLTGGACVPNDTRLLCQQFWPWNWSFGTGTGVPGFIPFIGAGGNVGGGQPASGAGGTAPGPVTTSVNIPPSPNVPGQSGQMMCSDNNGNYTPLAPDGTCPTGWRQDFWWQGCVVMAVFAR